MTETIDHLIQARFDTVASLPAEGDWADVLARARPAQPRRRPLPIRVALAAVLGVAVTATAVAFGWPQTVVDFFQAPPAPQSVKTFFGAYRVPVPGRVSPQAKLGQARKIMTATFDANHLPPEKPLPHTLYVAARQGGGFCFLWTNYGGSCADPEEPSRATTDPASRPLGLEWLEDDFAGFVDGWVRTDAESLEARFADGTTATIPITWVSEPIDAGFFAYVVPPIHQTRADALRSVVALDADGNVVGKQTFALTKPLDQDVVQRLPNGTKLMLPRRAQATRAREIVKSGPVYLWVMPRAGGGHCYLYGTGAGGGEGCTSPYWLARLPAVDGRGGNGLYFAEVKPSIAAVELRYRNGEARRLTPVDGFVAQVLKPGSRIVAVIGLDRSGKAIFRQQVPG
jgi:hypothetical protein